MLMLIDAFQPQGLTELAVDSVFMLPHLGIWAKLDENAALEVLERDCLVPLGWCVAPVGRFSEGRECAEITLDRGGGNVDTHTVEWGEIIRFHLEPGGKAQLTVTPRRGVDVGTGPGNEVKAEITGGVVGVVMDARGRPISLGADTVAANARAIRALGA